MKPADMSFRELFEALDFECYTALTTPGFEAALWDAEFEENRELTEDEKQAVFERYTDESENRPFVHSMS